MLQNTKVKVCKIHRRLDSVHRNFATPGETVIRGGICHQSGCSCSKHVSTEKTSSHIAELLPSRVARIKSTASPTPYLKKKATHRNQTHDSRGERPMCVYVCVSAPPPSRARMCVCVCVCVYEPESEREYSDAHDGGCGNHRES